MVFNFRSIKEQHPRRIWKHSLERYSSHYDIQTFFHPQAPEIRYTMRQNWFCLVDTVQEVELAMRVFFFSSIGWFAVETSFTGDMFLWCVDSSQADEREDRAFGSALECRAQHYTETLLFSGLLLLEIEVDRAEVYKSEEFMAPTIWVFRLLELFGNMQYVWL